MKTRLYDLKTEYEEGLNAAALAIAEGELVGMPTETVYGLAADAQNEDAVKNLFAVKGRPQDNPLIVHIENAEDLKKIAYENELSKKLAKAFWPGPLTMVLKKRPGVIPDVVTCNMDTVAVRLPKSEYARQLIKRSGKFIAAPSANISGRPSPTAAAHVMEDFSGKIPVVLDGGTSDVGVESTVVSVFDEKCVILRPGGITREMLLEVCETAEVSSAVLNGLKEGERAQSPGMKYKHYAPKARVILIEGDSAEGIANNTLRLYDKYSKEGKTLILCSEELIKSYEGRLYKTMGRTPADFAHGLFDMLRYSDEIGAKTVLLQATDTSGMGLAYMNRALRAAAFTVVK